LDTAVWPEGVSGHSLDAFALAALWRAGLDYRHGTSHGVGAALNVHEGRWTQLICSAMCEL
jgi:Xaa-Pro aminopeptidase